MSPSLVRERRLELPRRLTHAPQTCLSTCSSTLAYASLKARVIIAWKNRMSRINFRIFAIFELHCDIYDCHDKNCEHNLAANARLNKIIP